MSGRTLEVWCEHCGTRADVSSSLAGAIINCSSCGRAIEVPGTRDTLWTLVKIAGVAGAVAVGLLVAYFANFTVGVLLGFSVFALGALAARVLA